MFADDFEPHEVMQAVSWKTLSMPVRDGERMRAQRGASQKIAKLSNRIARTTDLTGILDRAD
jgi:hypothetical protein